MPTDAPLDLSQNPLREGLSARRPVEPCTIIVLGATGDLAARKLLPAIYNLGREGYLPARYRILGYARRPKSDEEFRVDIFEALKEHSRHVPESLRDAEDFLSRIHYQQGNLDSAEDYGKLLHRLEALESEHLHSRNRLFYFAIAPEFFATTLSHLSEAKLVHGPHEEGCCSRLIIEKPFGVDLDTARELNRHVREVFHESQVFRIDHYLGKETVQNILAFRFANAIFEPLWNSRHVESIQLTVAETVGMPGRRGQYFDTAGMLRDVVQNHALQLLSLVAMEPPASLDPEAVRDEKVRLIRAIPVFAELDVERCSVRGQYGAGSLGGKTVPGFREEDEVRRDSPTETYAALRLEVRNWRWAGVPFLVRAGKRLPKRTTEIAVNFRQPPHQVFPLADPRSVQNTLILRIQPDEGISLSFGAKRPGLTTELQPVKMDFRYGTSFGRPSPEAYERLLLDALLGDASLFTRADEIELAWERMTPILHAWEKRAPNFPNYAAGTWGPEEIDRLAAGLTRGWRRL